jgi:hypothetical protein
MHPIRIALFWLLVAVNAVADEGMWMPQQIPMLGDELRELGLQLDSDAFADLTAFPMGAVVSLGGCSAAFVSSDGLIITNHHCVYGSLQYNSTPERDLLQNGFLAATRADEVPALPTARVYVTTSIEDVTDEILEGLDDKILDLERAKQIDKRRKAIVKECEAPGNVRCRVSAFFSGEKFLKLTAMKILDVRLVYAPALGIGNFGDEEDNWMWPRHTGDFGFYRAYVGRDAKPAPYSSSNVPFQPKHHLKMSARDLDPDDLTLLAGYPGRTSRLVTAEEVREAQEFGMPASNRYRRVLLEILRDQGKGNRKVQISNATRISRLENILKKYVGQLQAFERDGLLHEKLESERQLEEYFGNEPQKAAQYAAIRDEFSEILSSKRETRERDMLHRWLFTASPMLSQANLLYRMSVEREKADDERDEGFQERDWERNKSRVRRTQRVIEPASDRAGLRWFLLEAGNLPAAQSIEAIDRALSATGREDVEGRVDAFLDALYANTRVDDLDTRLAMFDESTDQLMKHEDAMIEFAADLRDLGAEIEDRDRAFKGAEYRLRPQFIAAVRAMRNGRLAPDANGTLRVGFGVVKGYEPRDGVFYQPQTTVRGVLQKDSGERPFDSPQRLLERARANEFGPYADPDLGTLAVGFISTVNVTNGSSGSSALNARGEIIGLAFDMNWEGVAADWVVNEKYVRTIHVDSRYILWVMDAVDGAHNLMREMALPVHFPR